MTIRRVPGDFRVREVLREGPAQGHGFGLYQLTKESLTTPEAVAKLARALGVRPGECTYAGLKDKHAVTTQHVSVRDGAALKECVGAERWSAVRIGDVGAPLSARDIERNEFEIVVRDLTREACDAMDARAAALRAGDGLRVVNFFGEQRFGSARHGEGFAAKHLVRGEFEQALKLFIGTPHRKDSGAQRAFTRGLASGWGDWTRLARDLPRCPQRKSIELLASRAATRAVNANDYRDAFAALPYMLQELAVDAWQSWLWNRIVEGGLASGLALERDACVALPAPVARYEGPWEEVARRVLEDEGVTAFDLRVPGLRRPVFATAERPVWVDASGWSMSDPEADELAPPRGKKAPARFKRVVKFCLRSGAYATVVLRSVGE